MMVLLVMVRYSVALLVVRLARYQLVARFSDQALQLVLAKSRYGRSQVCTASLSTRLTLRRLVFFQRTLRRFLVKPSPIRRLVN